MNHSTNKSPLDQSSLPSSKKQRPIFTWEQVLSSLPSSPGVYWFLDADNQVIYVGKAKNLKNRLSSYSHYHQLSNKIKQMVSKAVMVKFKTMQSELEALLQEAELIRSYQPKYNTLLKDDKSPIYILITKEEFPRVLRVRKRTIIKNGATKLGTVLGPFPSSYKTNEVLKIARKIFPWCNKKRTTNSANKNNEQACFFYHIEQCPGVCVKQITTEKYQDNIKNLVLFLKGKKKTVNKILKKQMAQAVEQEDYETATTLRDQLQTIQEVTSKQHQLRPELLTTALKEKVSEDGVVYLKKILSEYLGLPKQSPLTRIEGYDVSNTQGTNSAVSMVTFIEGKATPKEYKVFNIKSLNTPNDYHMLQEALTRRQNHPEWGIPNLIVIDGGKGQVRAVVRTWQWYCPVIGIAKHPDRLVLPYYDKKKLKYHLLKLNPTNPALKLIQKIRDESHRFAQRQHKKRRLKQMLE